MTQATEAESPAAAFVPLRYRCGLLKNAWYAVARSEQVKQKPLGRVVLGEMVVVYRDHGGHARVLQDRCPHRNALLSAGRVSRGRIECSYHGWTFDGMGRCVNVPSEGIGEPKQCRKTESFPVREADGLIWAWFGGSAQPPQGEPFQMPYYKSPGFRSYYMETLFNNDVTNLVENFMDVPHTVYVHNKWFRSSRRTRMPITVERTENGVSITYHQDKDVIGWSEKILNPKALPLAHTDRFYMPNNTRVDYVYGEGERAFVITSTCTPISERQTRVFTLISYKLGRLSRLLSLVLPWYTRKVIQQDVDIMDVQGRALNHYKLPNFHSTPVDAPHLYIESLRSWAESGGQAPRPTPVKKELEFWL